MQKEIYKDRKYYRNYYENILLCNNSNMTLDYPKNCIILRPNKKLKDVDIELIYFLANKFIKELDD